MLPPGFRFPDKTDLWIPKISEAKPEPRTGQNYLALARLKHGVSLEQAQAEMTFIAGASRSSIQKATRTRALR